MNFEASDLLCCPLDQLALQREGKRLHCQNGHSFDIARQGYVNLLGASDKRSHDPGDSKEMIVARREFLDTGHYQPIADQLVQLLTPFMSNDSVVVDAGCGEGYYLQHLRSQLESNTGYTPAIIGYDISKWAVQAAARRLCATWLVASNRNIPIAPHSADCLLSLFGFPVFESFRNVLRKDGRVLAVNAGPQHLIELREIIYPSVKRTESTVAQQALNAGLVAGKTSTLQYQTAPLKQSEINNLLTMTPHLFRASSAGKERATRVDHLSVTVDVIFQFFAEPDDRVVLQAQQ